MRLIRKRKIIQGIQNYTAHHLEEMHKFLNYLILRINLKNRSAKLINYK